MSNFWNKIVGFFSKLRASIFGQMAMGVAADVLKELGKEVADALAQEAKNRAILLEQEYGPGTGDKKRKELAGYLGDRGTELGLSLSSSMINVLIEVAVAAMKRG